MKKLFDSFFFYLILGAILPYLLHCFLYLPVLDDYIQYGCYPLYPDPSYVYLTIGTLSTRPLAGLLDPVFWGSFWHIPGLALLLITALHLLSAWFFYKTLRLVRLSLSPLFFIVYLFAPLGMEGRFWLSGATRIIVGLFFATLSLWLLAVFLIEKPSYRFLFFFALAQLASYGFYESVTVFSALCALLLCGFCAPTLSKKNFFLPSLITIINLFIILFYYFAFKNLGIMGSRVENVSLATLLPNCLEVIRQVWSVFFHNFPLTQSLLGTKLLLSGGLWRFILFISLCLTSLALCRHISGKNFKEKNRFFCLLGCGILFFFAPLLPHVLMKTVWVTNRSLFVPMIGFALILEAFFGLFHKKHLQKTLIFAVSFLCLTANVNEYDTYLRVSRLDDALLEQVIANLDDDVLAGEKTLQVVLSKPVQTPQNAYHKDHVASVFGSGWALTGALRAKTKNLFIRCATPVLEGTKTDENMQVLWIDVPSPDR
ncbi:MAG: hypothetical protein E7400_05920 [Ruminococcaceae bacterium]|nr:hypothetical protein [Oscillospiraceae bacterium]